MSNYYMCSEGEVMAAALPTNFKLSSETELIYNEEIEGNFEHLSDDEFLVAEALLIKKTTYPYRSATGVGCKPRIPGCKKID